LQSGLFLVRQGQGLFGASGSHPSLLMLDEPRLELVYVFLGQETSAHRWIWRPCAPALAAASL